MIKHIKQVNLPLWIGLSIILVFSIISMIGPSIAPYPVSKDQEQMLHIKGSQILVAPEPPSSEHIFGKDRLGRDLLSVMLHGLKYTLFVTIAIAFLRIFIGGVLGLYFGMWKNVKKDGSIWDLLSGLPMIIILYFLLQPISIGNTYTPMMLIVIQSMVMIVIGIPSLVSSIRLKTEELRNRLSVLASVNLGASQTWIIRKHIFPFLKENFVLLFVQEMILVLNIIGQLSILNIFLGGTDMRGNSELFISKTFEWMGIIGQDKNYTIIYPWLVVIPLAAYLLLLFSFYLLSKGLERRYQTIYSRYPHL